MDRKIYAQSSIRMGEVFFFLSRFVQYKQSTYVSKGLVKSFLKDIDMTMEAPRAPSSLKAAEAGIFLRSRWGI